MLDDLTGQSVNDFIHFFRGMKKTFHKTLILGDGEGIFEPWPVGFTTD